jgi:hypothetical protein
MDLLGCQKGNSVVSSKGEEFREMLFKNSLVSKVLLE